MYVISFRVKPVTVLVALLVLALVAAASVMGIRTLGDGGAVTANAQEADAQRNTTVKNDEQRLEFVRSFGWEVQTEPAEVLEVIIPKEFDEIYAAYNAMQQAQGFDLTKFQGKRCKRYSFIVTNYPGQPEDVRLNLLVSGNKVIGGDVSSLLAGGFMHGFEKPAS